MPFQARPLGQGHRSHGAGGHERAGRHQGRGLRGGRAAALHQGCRQEPGRPQYRQGQGQGPRQRQERRRGRSRAGPLRKERRVLAGLDPDRTRRAGPRRRPPANHRRRRGDRELHQSLYLRGKGQSTSPRPRPHGLDRLDRLHGRGVSPVRPGGFRRSAGLSPRQGHEPQREQGPGADHRQSLLALQGAAGREDGRRRGGPRGPLQNPRHRRDHAGGNRIAHGDVHRLAGAAPAEARRAAGAGRRQAARRQGRRPRGGIRQRRQHGVAGAADHCGHRETAAGPIPGREDRAARRGLRRPQGPQGPDRSEDLFSSSGRSSRTWG